MPQSAVKPCEKGLFYVEISLCREKRCLLTFSEFYSIIYLISAVLQNVPFGGFYRLKAMILQCLTEFRNRLFGGASKKLPERFEFIF